MPDAAGVLKVRGVPERWGAEGAEVPPRAQVLEVFGEPNHRQNFENLSTSSTVSTPRTFSRYPTVNGMLALALPQSMRSVPPVAVSSTAKVSCSTGAVVLLTFIGARPRSCPDG